MFHLSAQNILQICIALICVLKSVLLIFCYILDLLYCCKFFTQDIEAKSSNVIEEVSNYKYIVISVSPQKLYMHNIHPKSMQIHILIKI